MTDRATERYHRVMIRPRSGGRCRYCPHSVARQHSQLSAAPFVWCAGCAAADEVCGAGEFLAVRQHERETARVTR